MDSAGIPQAYLSGEGTYPERLPWIVLRGQFLEEIVAAVDSWCTWAEETVKEWPDDVREATPDLEALRRMAAHMEERTARWQGRHPQ